METGKISVLGAEGCKLRPNVRHGLQTGVQNRRMNHIAFRVLRIGPKAAEGFALAYPNLLYQLECGPILQAAIGSPGVVVLRIAMRRAAALQICQGNRHAGMPLGCNPVQNTLRANRPCGSP